MNWLKKIFGSVVAWLRNYFTSGKAASDAAWVLEHIAEALPAFDVAATVVVSLTPTGVDDALWATFKKQFPELFNGSITSGDSLKLYMLGFVTEWLKAKFPGISTSVARATAQMAYLEYSAKK